MNYRKDPIQTKHGASGWHSVGMTFALLVNTLQTSACGIADPPPPPVDPSVAVRLLGSAVRYFDASRNEKGLYRDRLRFDGKDGSPASVAAIGMGLISLCIGDRIGVTTGGAEKAKRTVRSMLSLTHARNDSGFFYHFIDMETGAREGSSEFSTIDTAILVSGAMFVASCFGHDDELDSLAFDLWQLVGWPQAIVDPDEGTIYLVMLGDGTGNPTPWLHTRTYNEYIIVAWLAMLAEEMNGIEGPATLLWRNHYENPTNLRKTRYSGFDTLTDRDTTKWHIATSFLSSFVVQFSYYLCHAFATDSDYLGYMRNARFADKAWWSDSTTADDHEWGNGAGSAPAPAFYRADAVLDNPYRVVSPHIIAGFLPVDRDVSGIEDLTVYLESDSRAIRTINQGRDTLLWRYSLSDTLWLPEEIQGIDYSSMMLGLAAHVLGTPFFEEHNDFRSWLSQMQARY